MNDDFLDVRDGLQGVSDIYEEYANKEKNIEEIENENINANDNIEEKNEDDEMQKLSDSINEALNQIEKDENENINNDEVNSNENNIVTFKGTNRGIEIYFSNDDNVAFENIISELENKIEKTKEIFKDVRCGLILKGRKFSEEEEEKIVTLLRKKMNFSIDYINMDDYYSSDIIRKDLNDSKKDYAETMYYHGTLRSGQSLTCDSSVVIFGDVNPGSEVVAGGNLIVMGSLRGIVQAGQRSNDAYIVAFDMNPKQLRIGDFIARAADEGDDERIKKPHKAYLRDDQICIEAIDGTFNLIEKENV